MSTPELMGLTFSQSQWRAVTAPIGPLLVLAGPGAGKTRCLTGRIAFLLGHGGADPRRICALTFTNKAAGEIAERLRHGLGDAAAQLTLGTIHALCLRILRTHGHGVGLPAGFGVADEEHQRLVLGRLGVHTRRHRSLLGLFGRRRQQNHPLPGADEPLFWNYNRELRSNHLIDFDEILSLTCKLLEGSATTLAAWRASWDHLLVDEFQDLDPTQYAILRLLAGEHRSLFAVGDDEQSIFSWRGADPRVMRRFVEDFAVDAPVILDINCRCSTAIFEAARRILPPAEPFFAKNIRAVRESTVPVRAVGCADEGEETAWIASDLATDQQTSGLRRGEYAILYRTHQMGRLFEETLLRAGIPCRLARGESLSDDPVIAQLLASLRIVVNPESDLYIENLARKVMPEALLLDVQRSPGQTLLDRFRAHGDQANAADAARCWRFLYQVENLKGLRQSHGDLHGLVEAVFAQGIGQLDSPLEKCQAVLSDPESLPAAHALADRFLDSIRRGGRVVLAPAGGLEIPIKVMLQRALPELTVEYLNPASPNGDNAFALNLASVSERLRIVEIFKALQVIEGRRYRKGFASYVAFDTETTGLDIDRCEVIELAAVKVRDGRVIDTFRSLLRSGQPISPGATAVHGYTDAELVGQPSLREVWPRFRAFVGDDVLVAHNGHRFDIPLLERLTADWQGTRGLTFFDTLPLARKLFAGASLRLEGLAIRFGVEQRPNHRALDDSLCLVQVFERLQEERLRRSRSTCLANLLDCVALGAALEDRRPAHREDAAILDAASWRELRRPPAIVDAYTEESERFGLRCPPLQELLDRMGGGGWRGGRDEPTLRDRYPESYARLSRLMALVKATAPEEAIQELLDRTALSRSDGAGVEEDRVNLLTFHATKGLEFSRVYIAGVEDGQLPGRYALDDGREEEIHEARRLLYVAMTRAKDRLTLTYCKERNREPTGGTRFLDEMGLRSERMA
jgi:DNA polymerase III epsilon subunit family exonuclease